MKKILGRSVMAAALIALFLAAEACRSKPELHAKYYQMKGTVISVDVGHKQIIVSHEAIPGFMEAMTMSYGVKDDAVLKQLKPGDRFTARVVVTSDDVWLDNIVIVQKAAANAPPPELDQHVPQPGELVPDFTFVNQDGRREIRPRLYQDVCGMCGRTILTGENTTLFANPEDGNPVVVCPHCRQRARESGYQKAA